MFWISFFSFSYVSVEELTYLTKIHVCVGCKSCCRHTSSSFRQRWTCSDHASARLQLLVPWVCVKRIWFVKNPKLRFDPPLTTPQRHLIIEIENEILYIRLPRHYWLRCCFRPKRKLPDAHKPFVDVYRSRRGNQGSSLTDINNTSCSYCETFLLQLFFRNSNL